MTIRAPIRLATTADQGATAAMLARAFQDDPAFAYILPDSADREYPAVTSDGRIGRAVPGFWSMLRLAG